MLDGVDRAGQLLDAAGERGGEVVDDDRRRPDLAVLGLVGVERRPSRGRSAAATTAARRSTPRGGRRTAPPRRPSKNRCAGRRQSVVAGRGGRRPRSTPSPIRRRSLDRRPRLPQRDRLRVDGERRLVAEEVPRHRREHERQRRVRRRHVDHLQGGAEATLALGGDHDRRRLVGPVDRHLLGDVVGGRAGEAGGAHEDQRLGRQVDVLLVLGDVAGDRLVAELRQLDPQLLRGDAVRAVADEGPVAARRRHLGGDAADVGRGARAPSPSRREGPGARRAARRGRRARGTTPTASAMATASRHARRHLGVERLGRRHRHLDVAPVGRVQHAVGLVGEVAVAPVDDGDDGGAPTAGQVDGPVGVGGRTGLADGDDERVGHVGAHPEARQLGGRPAPRRRSGCRRRTSRGSTPSDWAATAAVPWPITVTRRMVPSRRGGRRTSAGSASGPRRTSGPSGPSTSLPRSVLRNDAGASPISLRRKWGCSPRSMSRVVICAVASSSLGDRQRRAVVGEARDPVELAGPAPSRAMTWPRDAVGLSGSAGVSPSMRR